MSRRAGFVLRVIASLGLAALVIWWVGAGELRATLAQLTVLSLLPVVAMHTGDRLLMAFKWQRLLSARHPGLSLGEAIRAYYVSSFAGVFLPMTVGADLVRIAALRRSAVAPAPLVGSIAVERALGAVSQALFAALAVALVIALEVRSDVALGWLALALAGGAVVALAAIPVSFQLARGLARRLAGHTGVTGKIGALADEYAGWRAHAGAMRGFFALTLLEGLFPIGTYLVAARALGVPTDAVEMTAIVPLVYLLARLPVSFGGIGAEQTGFAGAAVALGVMGGAEAAAVSLVVSPIALLIALLPGAIAWMIARRNGPSA